LRYRRKQYTLAQQYGSLVHHKGLNGSGRLTHFGFNFDFKVQPTPLSRQYFIRITMDRANPPKVYVLEPDLYKLAGDRKIPHLYSQKEQRLCLYLPGTGEWDHMKSVALTIVPWVFLWLYFFEDWLFSNEWKGGGEHPPPSEAS